MMRDMTKVWLAGIVLGICGGILAQGPTAAGSQVAGAGQTVDAQRAVVSDAETLRGLRRLVDTGHAEEALRQIAELKTKQAKVAGLSRVEGLALYAKGDLRGADQAFAEALAADAGDIEASEMRGLTLFRLGRPGDAIPLLEAARGGVGETANRKTDPNYLLGLCYMDTRRYDEARRAFATQFGFAGDGASAYLLTARMLLRREYLPIAQEFAAKAVELNAVLPLAHELLGEIQLAGNHLDEAIAEFEKERTMNPLEPPIYDRLGDAYGRAGRYEEARASLQEAVLLEPNSTGPYILLGKTMLKEGDVVSAATYLERAAKMDPANHITHSLLAQAYRLMGRKEDALKESEIAQRLLGENEPKLETVH